MVNMGLRRKGIIWKFVILLLIVMLTLALAGCSEGGKAESEPIAEEFRGGWDCEETTLEDPDSYTAYLHMEVSDDGS